MSTLSTPHTKTIYLVRHGETEGNRAWVHQSHTSRLSQKGLLQADALGHWWQTLEHPYLIASSLARAQETARIMSGREPDESLTLFEEIRRPSVLRDVFLFSPRALFLMGMVFLNSHRPNYHVADEENVAELRERARSALIHLSKIDASTIVVVTHRGFIASILAAIRSCSQGSIDSFLAITARSMRIPNGSVTTLHWRPVYEGVGADAYSGTWNIAAMGEYPNSLLAKKEFVR